MIHWKTSFGLWLMFVILAYEKPQAEGRYTCNAHTIRIKDMVQKLKSIYPNYNYPKKYASCYVVY